MFFARRKEAITGSPLMNNSAAEHIRPLNNPRNPMNTDMNQ